MRNVPEAFNRWVEKNADRIERARERGTLPYFIRDNERRVNRILEGRGDAESVERSRIAEAFALRRREAVKNVERVVRESSTLQTGILDQTRKAMKRAIGHTFNDEELSTLLALPDNVDRFRFERFSPLGEVKDLTSEKDLKNIATKRDRGVTGYNVYSVSLNGVTWTVKTEVIKNKREAIYHIKK